MERIAFRSASRRRVSLGKRDAFGLNALHRVTISQITRDLPVLCQLYRVIKSNRKLHRVALMLGLEIVQRYSSLLEILIVDNVPSPIRQVYDPMNFKLMEQETIRLGVDCSERFRFQSFGNLRRLLVGFNFPVGDIKLRHGYVMKAEEILLISLTRLSFPSRWSDLYERFPGRKRWSLQRAFYWFLDFMVQNWAYLVLNNRPYWKPHLAASANAIRIKLANVNVVNWRQYHAEAAVDAHGNVSGFRVALFIDDTMIPMCAPGGVMDDGPAAPRVPKEVQQGNIF
jgi:hypothetical protein